MIMIMMMLCIITVIDHQECIQRKYWALKDELNLNYEYMKKVSSKRTNLKIHMYFDIFLNEVLEYTTGNGNDQRNSLACISDAKVNDDQRYSSASTLIMLII